jgi:hypothetical protein
MRFYDVIPPTPVAGWPKFVEVHRIYCFDLYNQEPDESELQRIFESLPEYRPGQKRRWKWFGETMSDVPHLDASLDFNGITVTGILTESDWRAWDAAFQDRTSHFSMQLDDET